MAANYGTTTGANEYHLARGNAAWVGTEEQKLAALTRASTYIDALGQRMCGSAWVSAYPGVKTGGRGQELAWPRTGATDNDGIAILPDEVPREVEWATYEAALREITAAGSLSPDFVPSQQVKREKVDVLEVEYAVTSNTNGSNPNLPVISTVDKLLAPIMVSGCNTGLVFVV